MPAKKTKTTTRKRKTPAKKTTKKKNTSIKTSTTKKRSARKSTSKAPVYALIIMGITAGSLLLINHYRANNTNPNISKNIVKDIQNDRNNTKIQPDKKKVENISNQIPDKKRLSTEKKQPDKKTIINEFAEYDIYLIRFDEISEKLNLAPVKRKISTKSPLTNILNELIKGPNYAEENKGLLTAVPEDLRIRDVTIHGRNAEIDFNSAIEENANGEILLTRMDQLVYTVTQFEDIDGVVIKVNGRKKEFLGGEGLSVSKPLVRREIH